MSIAPTPALEPATFKLEHYEHMVACGAFAGEYETKHVELLRGRIYEKYSSELARFTLDHYEHMIAVGAFDEPYNLKVELLNGEIIMMSPIGPKHHYYVSQLTDWSYRAVDLDAIAIRVQGPIRIPKIDGEPEPDLIWTARKDYSQNHPEPDDVLLLVEVADSSLAKDRGPKLTAYAEAGIPEYWIVNLIEKQIEVHRHPQSDKYRENQIVRDDQVISPLAIPTAELSPKRLFAKKS